VPVRRRQQRLKVLSNEKPNTKQILHINISCCRIYAAPLSSHWFLSTTQWHYPPITRLH